MLCKCSGKYIDIYFNLKITFHKKWGQMVGVERPSYGMTDQVCPYLSRECSELLVEKTGGNAIVIRVHLGSNDRRRTRQETKISSRNLMF